MFTGIGAWKMDLGYTLMLDMISSASSSLSSASTVTAVFLVSVGGSAFLAGVDFKELALLRTVPSGVSVLTAVGAARPGRLAFTNGAVDKRFVGGGDDGVSIAGFVLAGGAMARPGVGVGRPGFALPAFANAKNAFSLL